MSERVIQLYEKSSFATKFFFDLNVKKALKQCINIKQYLLNNNHLHKHDDTLNLIISDGCSNEIENSYFVCKRYMTNGDICPMKKYTFINGKIRNYNHIIKCNIIIIDLYEEDIYLYNYSRFNDYIVGYLIDEEIKSRKSKNLIFSNKKIKINIKNINRYDTINEIDSFVNKFII